MEAADKLLKLVTEQGEIIEKQQAIINEMVKTIKENAWAEQTI